MGNLEIELYRGSITDLDGEVDALVNAANTHLWMGTGVAGAIKRAGGQEVEEEAVAKGPIPLGEAVATGAGKLRCKFVIHAAGMEPGGRATAEAVRDATRNSLLRAEELNLKKIALPALGTGVGGLSLEEVARVQLGEVRRFAPQAKRLKKIIFALFGAEAYEAYRQEIEG
ncbi:MAG: macro domain-containing protein [Candidatus Bipolaricaulia bacterium]